MEKRIKDVEAVIFDLDETLIDAKKGLSAAQRAVSKKIIKYFQEEIALTEEEMTEKLSDFDDEMNRKTLYERDQWWPKFLKRLGIRKKPSQLQIEDLTDTYWKRYAQAANLYPGVKSTLKYLKDRGIKLGIITDTDGSKIPKRERIRPLEIFDLIDGIIIAGKETPEPKPHPEGYKKLISKLGSDAKNTVMVGDKPFTDIKGANSLGITTVLVNRRDWDSMEKPDYTVNSIAELKNLI
ncbi:MAG: HAD family hydrolase [Candidatus Hadarchaeia archaeon]